MPIYTELVILHYFFYGYFEKFNFICDFLWAKVEDYTGCVEEGSY